MRETSRYDCHLPSRWLLAGNQTPTTQSHLLEKQGWSQAGCRTSRPSGNVVKWNSHCIVFVSRLQMEFLTQRDVPESVSDRAGFSLRPLLTPSSSDRTQKIPQTRTGCLKAEHARPGDRLLCERDTEECIRIFRTAEIGSKSTISVAFHDGIPRCTTNGRWLRRSFGRVGGGVAVRPIRGANVHR